MICKSNKNVGAQSNENKEEFLYLWKGADLGIPWVEDVHRRLIGLKQNLLSLS